MRAVGYRKSLPIEDANSLLDVEVDRPEPGDHDLLVEVKAVAVNPVDTKVRKRAEPPEGEVKILGYDAAGVVVATGAKTKLFKPGDEVFYAGSLVRQGTNSQFHAVDERIVGRKPKNLTFAQAAALPLTSITAWEMLFDRLGVKKNDASDKRSLLLVGGAGGVGSIAIQLARKLTSLTVIATASRSETIAWCRDLGAHHVVNHSRPMPEQLKALGFAHCDLVVSLTATDAHLPAMAEIVAPQGKFGLIGRSKIVRRAFVQAQERVAALGIHVHAPDVRHPRHRRAECAAQRGFRAGRSRRDPHHADGDVRDHQRRQPAPRACADRKRQGQRQDRAGRLLTLSRGISAPPKK